IRVGRGGGCTGRCRNCVIERTAFRITSRRATKSSERPMIPQSTFMVLAPIDPAREPRLRELLASMNHAPGRVNADNALFPFAQFDAVHVARFVILDDRTTDDIRCYGITPPTFPVYLAFAGEVDGDGDAFLTDAGTRAASGLRSVFSCCENPPGDDLLAW